MRTAHLNEVNPILPVPDIEAAVRFYTDKLGFRVSFRDCSAPDKYVGVRRDGVELHLQYQHDEDMPKPGTLMIRVVVDDPDELFREYETHGVFQGVLNNRARLEDKPWGTREFAFCDLNGHGLTFYRDL